MKKLIFGSIVTIAVAMSPFVIAKPIARLLSPKLAAQHIADEQLGPGYRSLGCYQKSEHVFTAVYENDAERVDVWIRRDQVALIQRRAK